MNEEGYHEALTGLSLSYNRPVSEMKNVADKIYANGSHGKFLESISVWLDITAPRYWWQEFSTYRIGTSCNSESTMHTIFKRELTQEDFVRPILQANLDWLNHLISCYKDHKEKNLTWNIKNTFMEIKNNLPEGFLQRRIICTNYKTIRHIINQRENHRLEEWKVFCEYLKENCRYSEWLK